MGTGNTVVMFTGCSVNRANTVLLQLWILKSMSEEENMNPDVSRNPQESQGKLNFKCSDVGPKNCDWQVSGNSEQEIMPKIEQHGREKHNMTIDDATRNKVRNSIRRQAA
jgi:predicted small metal-binding protein